MRPLLHCPPSTGPVVIHREKLSLIKMEKQRLDFEKCKHLGQWKSAFKIQTAYAQARSVWTNGMKIHLGSSKFSGKCASGTSKTGRRKGFHPEDPSLLEAVFTMLEAKSPVETAQAPAAILTIPEKISSQLNPGCNQQKRHNVPKVIIVTKTIKASMDLLVFDFKNLRCIATLQQSSSHSLSLNSCQDLEHERVVYNWLLLQGQFYFRSTKSKAAWTCLNYIQT